MYHKNIKAMLFGIALGDGWLSESYNNNTKFYQLGFSGDAESLKLVKKDLILIYEDIGKAKINTKETISESYGIKGTTSMFCCNQKVANDFVKLHMPIGKRVENEWCIPNWIINGSKIVKSNFLSGWYAAEGYTPKMQKNDITLKPLGFKFHKRKNQEENRQLLVSQFSKILTDLDIEYDFHEKEIYTCDLNMVSEFTFKNNHNNLIKTLNILDLKYNIPKKTEIEFLREYYKLKQKCLNKNNEALKLLKESKMTNKQIADLYDISVATVRGWRRRGTKEAKIPNTFIKYTDFKKQYMSTSRVISSIKTS